MTANSNQGASSLKTVPDLLDRSVALFPDRPAYSECKGDLNNWRTLTWKEVKTEVEKWSKALSASGLKKGDNVAVLLPNSINAALADLSILYSGMTPVPLHAIDTPASSAYIINNSVSKLLIVPKTLRWNAIRSACKDFPNLKQVVVVGDDVIENAEDSPVPVTPLKEWLKAGENEPTPTDRPTEEDLAAILYTSGTTGRPKGVMLTHTNIVSNAMGIASESQLDEKDVFLSFLPFSHTFERSCTYYHALSIGAEMKFVRNATTVAEDLQYVKPTCFNTVPRVYEILYQKIQSDLSKESKTTQALAKLAVHIGWRKFCKKNGLEVEPSIFSWLDPLIWPYLEKKFSKQARDALGGNLKYSLVGGAALGHANGTYFCAMGIPVLQGFGMTETSPAVTLNKKWLNDPITCGSPIPHVQIRIGEDDELQVKGPNVMKGYWNLPEATAAAFTEDGWLKTGDQAHINDRNQIRITGRIKEIIVTSTGEKIPPNDLENAILGDPLFDQVMVVGEGRPFVVALAVVNPDEFAKVAKSVGADPNDPATYERKDIRKIALQRIKKAVASFPQYGIPRNVWLLKDNWTLDDGLLTVTLKNRRGEIAKRYKDQINYLYHCPQ
ncbi:MAG: long-chain fatty acid--CoA ligase [Burkholderiales bacterium]|nr:long-chain fatty acid--CoA ligase [Burkholderiales bacterium]